MLPSIDALPDMQSRQSWYDGHSFLNRQRQSVERECAKRKRVKRQKRTEVYDLGRANCIRDRLQEGEREFAEDVSGGGPRAWKPPAATPRSFSPASQSSTSSCAPLQLRTLFRLPKQLPDMNIQVPTSTTPPQSESVLRTAIPEDGLH